MNLYDLMKKKPYGRGKNSTNLGDVIFYTVEACEDWAKRYLPKNPVWMVFECSFDTTLWYLMDESEVEGGAIPTHVQDDLSWVRKTQPKQRRVSSGRSSSEAAALSAAATMRGEENPNVSSYAATYESAAPCSDVPLGIFPHDEVFRALKVFCEEVADSDRPMWMEAVLRY